MKFYDFFLFLVVTGEIYIFFSKLCLNHVTRELRALESLSTFYLVLYKNELAV